MKKPAEPPPIRLVVVDDSELVRTGLSTLLEDAPDLKIVGEAANARDALAVCARHLPQVVLLDIRLPDGDGREVCRRLLLQQPELRVLFLTSADDPGMVEEAIRAGAHGYLLKEINPAVLARAIRSVAGGQSVLDPQVTGRVLELARTGLPAGAHGPNPLDKLSPQERRILALIASGGTNKEVGLKLNLSDKTVKNYLSSVFVKLRVSRRAEAAAIYAQHQTKC